jgi:hypothetical protein
VNIPGNIKALIIFGLAISGAGIALIVPPIAQNPDYHSFADQRMVLGVPNFWNVLSNLSFVIVGMLGIKFLMHDRPNYRLPLGEIFFFSGVLLVGFGSGYYHMNPSNQTLVWDRLPMAVSFMAFFSIIVAECIDNRVGRWMLCPLVLVGISSVIYWYATELKGCGDLRPYMVVQFLPALLLVVILFLYKSDLLWQRYVWAVLAAYAAAKVVEALDVQIYSMTGIISGHTLKHLFAALGAYLFLIALQRKR